jgi:predicted nucleotidyltransferase
MTGPRIDFSREKFAALCRKHGIRRVAFFGSVLRDDFTAQSDIDMHPKYLNRRLRDRVLADAEVVYAA